MNHNRTSSTFLIVGLILLIAGVISWQAGWDLPLHRLFRLTGTLWTPRVVRLSRTVIWSLGGTGVIAVAFALGYALEASHRPPATPAGSENASPPSAATTITTAR